MNTKFEIIKHSGNLPFSIFLHESKRVYPMNWHKEIEILFILKGSVRVKIRDSSYMVHQDNIILINSYEMHEITPLGDDIIILVFQLDPYFYQKYYQGFTEIVFHMNSTMLNKDSNTYNTIKENLVIMMWYRLNKENTYQIKLLKQSLALVELLLRNFKKTMINDKNHNDRSQQRLISIIENINKNYNKKLTLSQIAEQEYISIHYLSKFFKNRVGIGFNKYLNLFRLNKSMNDLLNSNKMIIDIALEHGFSSVKSYTKLFKETYTETPSSFRKKYLSDISPKKKNTSVTFNSRTILHNYIQLLAKDFLSGNLNQVYYLTVNMLNKSIDTLHKENILQINTHNNGMDTILKNSLEAITNELHIDYIRFGNIFDKTINFMNDDKSLNWFYIDNLLELLINARVRPFIRLSYNEKFFTLKQWNIIVEAFINHCLAKFGIYQVSSWKLEISCVSAYYDKFINLYNNVIKKLINNYKDLKIGILINLNKYFTADNILDNYNFSKLDFITIEINDKYYWKNSKTINEIVKWLKSRHIHTYIYQNRTVNELYDTCFISNYFVYNHLNIYKSANLIVPLIDPMINSNIFNGKDSLLTYNGLKKPIYNTYYLLDKVKGNILDQGEYYIVVKNHDRYYILLYYYNQEIGNKFNYSKDLNYNFFSKKTSSSISTIVYVNLKLTEGNYKVRTYLLNQENGCIFSEWLNMGSPIEINKEDMNFLRSKENMRISVNNIYTKDSLHLESSIRLNEVRLIEVIKK
ncbi:helix-turn-helix domain-containing protein [Vallitalea sp.]|jgi:xylan 1,4-beta-xylosidase|uniref:helix-turn-helix domain-containing protein n=1 Tax=Vallitalea sp. TaxID=1882829 RepID=UPI0025FE7662|nr:helix-turn-helix domain-containing protein [Vallitalea sp.]MCT4688300.1 helix-turn-helix domain-containing protein [Vallitalea sp.]